MSVDLRYNNLFFPGETWANYVPLNTLETNANFSSWSVDLYHAPTKTGIGALAWPSVLTLTKDIITGSSYRFYFPEQTIPINIADGCYRILITDTTGPTVLYISEIIEFISSKTNTLRIRYRNDKNIQNYNYVTLASFKNIQRIKLKRLKGRPLTNSTGFDRVGAAFKLVRSTSSQIWEFTTGWFDSDSHEAFNSATIHTTFEVFIDGNWIQHNRTDSSDYSTPFEEDYPLIQGIIELEQTNKASSNKAV